MDGSGPGGAERRFPMGRLAMPAFLVFVLALTAAAVPLTALAAGDAPTSSAPPPAVEESEGQEWGEELGEEEEEEEVGCEEAEEFEPAECDQAAGPEPVGAPSHGACTLRSARAEVFVYRSRSRVRLAIHYTSSAPAEVTVETRLSGRKGPLRLGRARRHLRRRGLLRLTERLDEPQMAKALAAARFTVELHVPGAPRSCQGLNTRQLTVHRTNHGRAAWLQWD